MKRVVQIILMFKLVVTYIDNSMFSPHFFFLRQCLYTDISVKK